MKLLSSFKKELILATRSFYFYVEILLAFVVLAVVMFAIPEHSRPVETEYFSFDMPQPAAEYLMGDLIKDDIDGKYEDTSVSAAGQTFSAKLIETEDRKIYVVENEQAVKTIAENQMHIGVAVSIADGGPHYKYFLQGYESQRLKNLISAIFSESSDIVEQNYNSQQVRALSAGYEPLSDRENSLPPLLVFNCSLMGMFIMAAYVFLDKKEGVIKAFAVTTSPVSKYLLSKIFVILLTAVFSGLVVLIPVMGTKANYALAVPLLLTSGFFSSAAGLLLASFYRDISKAFGIIMLLLILMMLPAISYFMPGWNPLWVKLIPSDPMMQAFKESITVGGDALYTALVCTGLFAAGIVLFIVTNIRFKRTLSA